MPDEMLSLLESGNICTTIEPVAYDTSNIPELENSEILKIAQDVLDSAKYAYASVAANPEETVRSNTLEEAFKDSFNLMDAAKRESIREKGAQLTGLSETAREVLFGRYGTIDSKSFLAHGFDRADEDLESLELDMKLLGIRTPMVSMPTSTFTETPEGLLLPKDNIPTSFEELETNFEEAAGIALESGVHNEENLADIWGPAFAEDPFEMDLMFLKSRNVNLQKGIHILNYQINTHVLSRFWLQPSSIIPQRKIAGYMKPILIYTVVELLLNRSKEHEFTGNIIM